MPRLAPLLILILLVEAAAAQTAGNPDNWCRAGFFTTEAPTFEIGAVKPGRSRRAYFYTDDEEGCPGDESCRTRGYVVTGDKLVVSKRRRDFVCAWYEPGKGFSTVGWIRAADLITNPTVPSGTKPWLGEWKYADNAITFTDNKLAGWLNVTGDAIWNGIGDNVHVGEIDGRYEPRLGVIEYSDGQDTYDCKATLRLVGEFMVVADNMHCGGANVSFSGVY